MNETGTAMAQFAEYAARLRGDEKGEAQVFCDRLFKAFGHDGYKEAGATLEKRVTAKDKNVRFADLVWPGRVLIEMKRRGAKLQSHYRQAFEYWIDLVPNRPRFVILCNFDELWVYDFNQQLDDPVDRVSVGDLPTRYTAFNFLFPVSKPPLFGNDRVAVTRLAADKVARVFNSLVARGENRATAQRLVLQCVMAMFSEDYELLPRGLFSEVVGYCAKGESTYDLFGGLFAQMNSPKKARGGRFVGVPYFNGGLFATVEPVELTSAEIDLLVSAAAEDWSRVQPAIFGTLFQSSMDQRERHALGAHFTSEADIQKVVLPTIVRPWRERIASAKTLKEMLALRDALLNYRVLDPACGSGNFLFVAYRELKRLEMDLLARIHGAFGRRAPTLVGTTSLVSLQQLYGLDINPFAVELAKVTLILAKETALTETRETLDTNQVDLPLTMDTALPLDNLDDNIRCCDALFSDWPRSDAIIGNPPFQSKNKRQQEFDRKYLNTLSAAFPDVPGRADYCVYWFRRAHLELPDGGRAGLVGTNTIRQNFSRKGGLEPILNSGGTITEAVASQVWSGDAVVHVSIVNWKKGEQPGKKKLFKQALPGFVWVACPKSGLRTSDEGRRLRPCATEISTRPFSASGLPGR